MLEIRRIQLGEFETYRAIRLEALKEAPQAFQTTYASAAARDEQSWREQAEANAMEDGRAIFFALKDGAAVALAGIYRPLELDGVGELCQVWVAPEHRGDGTARRLVEAVLAWAREQNFRQVLATIRAGNGRATRFYEKLGFVVAPEAPCSLPSDTVLKYLFVP